MPATPPACMPESIADERGAGSDATETGSSAGAGETPGGTDAPPAAADREAADDGVLDADLLPSLGGGSDADGVDIKIYVVTGRHGGLRVPESFCRECHMFARRADAAAEQADVTVNVHVYSWWTRFLGALRYGGYHPPVMVVGGKRLCQGHHVPTTQQVLEAIDAAVERS